MNFGQRRRILQAGLVCRAGGIVAYPTEAVYGLGCDPFNPDAVDRIYHLKQRPSARGLILVADCVQALVGIVRLPDGYLRNAIEKSWPGPTTWVLPAVKGIPPWLVTDGTIAVRVSDHPIASALAEAAGGLVVSTSANRAGHPPARTALMVRRLFGVSLDFVVPGNTGARTRPSGIRNGVNGEWLRRP